MFKFHYSIKQGDLLQNMFCQSQILPVFKFTTLESKLILKVPAL